MSCVKIDPALHQSRKPEWIKVRLPSNPVFFSTKALISDLRLHTVCEEAQCPNRWECWSQGTATFMIAGDRCTRACGFCAVTTAVARDDISDGGAEHFARTIEAVRAANPGIVIEVLVPDFHNREEAVRK